MIELIASPQQQKFGQDKYDALPRYCRECEVRFACHGGCPKDRFILTPDGEPGLTFAIVNVPQAMAHALLATVNPVLGIYTLMMPVPSAHWSPVPSS